MKKLIVILLIIASIGLALNIHIVQLDNSIKFLKKTEMTFTDTYVDARGFNKIKILAKPALIKAGIKEIME